MPAYIIVDLEITDPDGYADYGQRVPPTVAAYGGRYLVRGGTVETLEGDWQPKRLVVLEFDSAQQARAWWASEEYREPKAMRRRAARTRMLLVEGVPSIAPT